MPTNRIVTRGMGPSRGSAGRAGLVTQGYGGIIGAIVGAVSAVIRGGTRALRRLPELIYLVRARLVDVNDREPPRPLTGADHALVDPNEPTVRVNADLEATAINSSRQGILIAASRLSSTRKKGGGSSE